MHRAMNRRSWLKQSGLLAAGTLASGRGRAADAPAPGAGEILLRRSLPVKHDVDVFVAGGGPAGTAAAVAASSQGALRSVKTEVLKMRTVESQRIYLHRIYKSNA